MNHRVRKYSPVFLSPQHSKINWENTERKTQTSKHWKTYLNKEVSERYHLIAQNGTSSELLLSPSKSVGPLCIPSDSFLERSLAKSTPSQWEAITPQKKRALQLCSYESLSTSISKGTISRRIGGDQAYRLQLLEE